MRSKDCCDAVSTIFNLRFPDRAIAASWLSLITKSSVTKILYNHRLVDVTPINNAGDVSLSVQERTQARQHVALSYCRGSTIPDCRLLSSTPESSKTRIAWKAVPRTLQEAIAFTRRLGLRYLWIDALCVIQDNADDWAREAALMSDVYQNSYLTLAGLHSSENTNGLFSTRGSTSQSKLLYIEVEDQNYDLHLFDMQAHPDLDISDNATLNPLLRCG